MSLLWWLLLSSAWPALPDAGDGDVSTDGLVDPSSAADEETDTGEEPRLVEFLHDGEDDMIVWGEMQVEAARQEVIRELREQGYTREIRKKDKSFVILRHDDAWKGEVLVYDDGWIRMRRQPVQFEGREMPWAPRNSAGAWAGCIIYPWACLKMGGVLIGKRKFVAQKRRTLAVVEDDATDFAERLADHATTEWANDLPDELQRLWDSGVPIDSTEEPVIFEDVVERRAALLAFWDSRTENPWGEQVRRAVEAFLQGEVQCSDHPVTAEELHKLNIGRQPLRPLALSGCGGGPL